jgi:hypothetical protein
MRRAAKRCTGSREAQSREPVNKVKKKSSLYKADCSINWERVVDCKILLICLYNIGGQTFVISRDSFQSKIETFLNLLVICHTFYERHSMLWVRRTKMKIDTISQCEYPFSPHMLGADILIDLYCILLMIELTSDCSS